MKHFLQLKAAASLCGKGSGKKPFPITRNSSIFLCPVTLKWLPYHFAKTGKAFVFWVGCLHTRGFVDMLCTWHVLIDPYRWLSFLRQALMAQKLLFFFLPFKPHLICLGIQKLLWIKTHYSDLVRYPLSTSGLSWKSQWGTECWYCWDVVQSSQRQLMQILGLATPHNSIYLLLYSFLFSQASMLRWKI